MIKHILISLIFITLVSVAFAQELVDSRKREIVITNVNVVPMDTEKIIENQMVIIKDGKVTAIGPKLKYGKHALVINGKGKFLMPGLAELHAHVPPVDNIDPMKDVLFLFAANGITTIRGMLGHPRHLELRDKLQKGDIIGPRFFTTGPSFNGMSVTSPEAGAEMVRKQKLAGYDFLKLHPGLTRDKFDAIASTAKQEKIPFVGHVSFGVGIWRAIDAQYSSIDHLDGFVEGLVPNIKDMVDQQTGSFGMYVGDQADSTQIPKLMNALREKNIWVVPTQSLAERWFSPTYEAESIRADPDSRYMSPEVINQWIESKKNIQSNPSYEAAKVYRWVKLRRKLIRACVDYDVKLLLGSDAPQVFNVPGFSTHNELLYLTQAGLTPYQALKTGTINAGKYLRLDKSGFIAPGTIADLILINGNPLTDISQTRNIAGVFLNGQWLSREYIDKGLEALSH
ncbi:amidohydrolase family protein [Pseudochryseolinea flava]|uniref:Amidohydrolase n=1 Tax=Pseudochryseolinea flava TaxID=2059302 RepID=A0A364Y110_9BACT|nr:amidohydrolase family protein [Pseudochryseolinea flava]RAW00298.1 amidohydrolase [Pseudochryseolinea flava]